MLPGPAQAAPQPLPLNRVPCGTDSVNVVVSCRPPLFVTVIVTLMKVPPSAGVGVELCVTAKSAVCALVADAALSSAFVPVFSDLLEHRRRKEAYQLASALPGARPRGRLIALGGTARALARRHLREGTDRPKRRHAATISLAELVRLRKRLEPMSVAERKQLRGMRPWRADIVIAGALVREQLMEESGYAELTVCSASVREGVLWREARRVRRSK